MPLYEYECTKCKHRFEKIEKVTAPRRQRCPKCKGRAERLHSAPAIQFKGSGWYVTDYARKGAAPSGASGGESKTEKAEKPAAETKVEKKEPAKKEHKSK